ncbi:hypothetical protein [Acinetobacter rudis]|uniref:Lipoprotein n=3 Tax=Acinetobacter rudis TaxID=632955 RepID=S3MT09_9GAMM|nr:hypothetical protein [Acinetobacter rudis]EPF70970.1 hypothetical protein F945_02733 [Acinetobacter rudis CIP 110305]
MKTKLKLTALALSSVGLASCTTVMLKESIESSKSRNKAKTVLQDQLIAVGMAKTPITHYENAVVLAGKQFSYLITPTQGLKQSPQLFQQILTQVDLRYAQISQNTVTVKDLTTATEKPSVQTLEFKMNSTSTESQQDIAGKLYINFTKPLDLLKAGEQKQLEGLQFKCDAPINGLLNCRRNIEVNIRLASAINSTKNLQHTLNNPVFIKVVEEKEGRALSKATNTGKYALYPLAVTVDIVTSPIQFAIFYFALKDGKWMRM